MPPRFQDVHVSSFVNFGSNGILHRTEKPTGTFVFKRTFIFIFICILVFTFIFTFIYKIKYICIYERVTSRHTGFRLSQGPSIREPVMGEFRKAEIRKSGTPGFQNSWTHGPMAFQGPETLHENFPLFDSFWETAGEVAATLFLKRLNKSIQNTVV